MVQNRQQHDLKSHSDGVANPSEQDLAQEIHRALRATGYGPLKNVQVVTQENRTILCGKVETYFLKQLAGSVVSTVTGVRSLENSIEVS